VPSIEVRPRRLARQAIGRGHSGLRRVFRSGRCGPTTPSKPRMRCESMMK